MKFQITHKTAEYRGDHSADVSIAIELEDGETFESLFESLLQHDTDVVEIRRVAERKPKP